MAVFKAGMEGKRLLPDNRQAVTLDPDVAKLLEMFKVGLENEWYVPEEAAIGEVDNPEVRGYNGEEDSDTQAEEPVADPAVAELLERFKAGMDGRKYTFESFERNPIKRLRVMYGAGERSNEI